MNTARTWITSRVGVLALYFCSYAGLWLYRVTEIGRVEQMALPSTWLPYSELFWLLVCGGIPLFLLQILTPYSDLSPLHFWRKPVFSVWFWRYFVVMMAYILVMNMTLFKEGQSIWRFPILSGVMWIRIFLTVLIEETAFRGVIYHGLCAVTTKGVALFGSSTLFVLWHIPAWLHQGIVLSSMGGQLLNLCLFAILLTSLTRYSKSLYPAMIFHVLYNFSLLL